MGLRLGFGGFGVILGAGREVESQDSTLKLPVCNRQALKVEGGFKLCKMCQAELY